MADTNAGNRLLAKKLLKVPKLPDTVQGDGRYLMRLLKEYLEQQAIMTNLANGFTADEIYGVDPDAMYMPRFFTFISDRNGSRFEWSPPIDMSRISYYELRTDTNVGSSKGLLETGILTTSSKALPTTLGTTVYLYAVNTNRTYSNPVTEDCNKAQPEEPEDIALTKNNEGTLITFKEIPSNCIGAYVDVDGVRYKTQDNVFLYKNPDPNYKIKEIYVAYYDSFQVGEWGYLGCVVPNVKGFLVERNGSNLDFYWDAVDVYKAKYEVRVSKSTNWNEGIVLFVTETNNKNRKIYPNEGQYYLLIKAIDNHGNYSEDAAWQVMNTQADIHRNVILKHNEADECYPGSKVNMCYDLEGEYLKLLPEATFGEYIMDVVLPQRYRARNWLSFECLAYTDDSLKWDDAGFMWDDAVGTLNGSLADNSLTEIDQKIAFYVGAGTTDAFVARENGSVTPEKGGTVLENHNADEFTDGHYGAGVKIKPTTRLAYTVSDMPTQFSMVFSIKLNDDLTPDTVFMTLVKDDDYLRVGYDSIRDVLYLLGSDGEELTIPGTIIGKSSVTETELVNGQEVVTETRLIHRDWLTFGISQGETQRSFFVNSLVKEMSMQATADAIPLCKYEEMYCYPKFA